MRLLKTHLLGMLVIALSGGLTAAAWAQDLYIYPKKGRSQDQLEKDKYECYQWAKGKTGFDPMATPRASTPPPQGTTACPLRGAARGAAVGAIGGAIGGNAGKGAAIGAGTGAVLGGMRRRQQSGSQQQQARDQASAHGQRRNEYNRAFGACLEGRGYTVK